MPSPAWRTMVRYQHILDARDERSLRTCGAEQHVRLKRQDKAVSLVAQGQDRTGNARDPVGAVGCARLFIAISQEVLCRHRRFDATKPAHLDRQGLASLAGLQ